MKNHLILGNWNALCDSCGRKFKASDLKKRWDGLIVCQEDWEQRHPQDLLRVQREQISVPWSRPYPAEDTYITKFGLVDTATMHDYEDEGGYIDPTYFATDYVSDFYILATWKRQFNDQLNILDALANKFSKTLTDSVSLSETVAVTRRFVRSFTDTATMSDALAVKLSKALSDVTTVTDSIVTATKYARTLTDSVSTPTEALAVTFKKTLTDTVSLSDAVAVLLKLQRSLSDSVSFTDSGNVLLKNYIDPTLSLIHI